MGSLVQRILFPLIHKRQIMRSSGKTLQKFTAILREIHPDVLKGQWGEEGRNGAGPIEGNLQNSEGFCLHSTPRCFFFFSLLIFFTWRQGKQGNSLSLGVSLAFIRRFTEKFWHNPIRVLLIWTHRGTSLSSEKSQQVHGSNNVHLLVPLILKYLCWLYIWWSCSESGLLVNWVSRFPWNESSLISFLYTWFSSRVIS